MAKRHLLPRKCLLERGQRRRRTKCRVCSSVRFFPRHCARSHLRQQKHKSIRKCQKGKGGRPGHTLSLVCFDKIFSRLANNTWRCVALRRRPSPICTSWKTIFPPCHFRCSHKKYDYHCRRANATKRRKIGTQQDKAGKRWPRCVFECGRAGVQLHFIH